MGPRYPLVTLPPQPVDRDVHCLVALGGCALVSAIRWMKIPARQLDRGDPETSPVPCSGEERAPSIQPTARSRRYAAIVGRAALKRLAVA